MGDARNHRDGDDQRGFSGEPQHHERQLAAGHVVAGRGPGGLLQGAAAEAERPQCTQVVAQRVGVSPEDLDRLERVQRDVELRCVAVERVERLPHSLLLVALLGDWQVLDPRQRPGRRVGRGPGIGHGDSMRSSPQQ